MKARRLTTHITNNSLNGSIGKSAPIKLNCPKYENIKIVADGFKCAGEYIGMEPYVGLKFLISELEIEYEIVEDEYE